MSTVVVTGSGGLIGSEAVAHFIRAGYDVVGVENDMRAQFFGPDASTSRTTTRLQQEFPSEFRSVALDIRDAEGILALFKTLDLGGGHPHGRAALARLGGVGPADGLRRQRQRHDEPARGHPPDAPRGDVHLHLDQQGLRRHAQLPAAAGRRRAPGAARGSPLLRRHRHVDVDRWVHALAVRRLQGGGGPDGAGVRPLLRHADGVLPRRLSDRSPARGRAVARLPLLPDALHGQRRPVHRLRLRRQAGARQHPLR